MKLYRRFLATYLCVCLIPLVFSLAQVVGMRQEIQRSIAKDQEVTLRTAQGDLESSLVEAANTLDLLSENELLESLSLEETVSSTALYDMCSLIPVLTVASQQRASYVSCFAYFPSSGYLVSNKSTYHPDLAGISTWDLNIQYQDLLAKLEESGVNASVRTIYSQDGQNGYLLISKNCYDSRYRTLHASLGILIQLDREESFLDTDSTKMFVLEADGTLFCGDPGGAQVASLAAGKDSAQGRVRLSGQTWLYSVYPGESLSNLRYGLLVLENAYYRSLEPLLIQLAALILVIAAGVILAVFLSRRTWSPFRQILPIVRRSAAGRDSEYHSLAEFSQALTDFAKEKELLLKQVLASEQREDALAIWQYLLGFTQDSSCLSRYLEESQPYRLLSFSPSPAERTACEASQGGPRGRAPLCKVVEQVFLDRQDGVCLTIGNSVVVALVQNTVELEEIRQKAAQAQEEAGLPLVCYVSEVCLQLSNAPEAWSWIQRAADRDSFWQESRRPGVWLARDLLEYPSYFGDFPLHRKQLFAALASGKPERVRKLLDTILQEDLLDPRLPVELIRNRCVSIIEALLPYLEEKDHPLEARAMTAPTAQEMGEQLLTLFQHAKLQPEREDPAEKRDNQLVAQVQSYIRENYQDPFLNVSLIADRLGRNLSTLSHQYKDLTGHGLLEDLHAVRLEAAKRLLTEGKTVRETAELVGYGDSRALIRAFKRYEGSTPGQFVEKK